jgi:NTE family protein
MVRKKIGLALSGGGARGFAHVGVIKVLERHGIGVDYISGTSIGSFVGGALASGLSVADIEAIARNVRWRHMTRPSFSPRAILSNAPMARLIRRKFPVTRFEEAKIPFTAVACDILSGKEVRLNSKGDMISAIRASCAVPAIFTPVTDEQDRVLVDGGVVAPVPTDAVRAMGADVVIAVDLLSCGAGFRRVPQTALGMLFNSAMTLLRSASDNQVHKPDVVIIPAIAHIRPDRLGQREECLSLGEEAAEEQIEEITRLVKEQ